ncbi:MAG: hypothetical protein PWQ64_1604 [Desulfomicrobiaceae bacterium]|nr:family finger-like protein [Desulfomicrobiaceae bacterium]MDI3492735.1 hypothetical protein [Desulfomicrobiaceae bacterium]MDK2873840.1 hypothetical protein [Desulfomicrobiaceae bacterium]
MRITCPNCGFSRHMPPEKLPKRPVRATCPQCRHKFPFTPPMAADSEPPAPAPQEPVRPVTAEEPPLHEDRPAPPPADESAPDADIWEALHALRPDEPAKPQTAIDPEDRLEDDPEGESELLPPEAPEPLPPTWETATTAPFAAYLSTLWAILVSPVRFFRTLPVGAGYIKPLLFFLILAEAVAVAQALWQLLGVLPPAPLTEGLGSTAQATVALLLYPLQISFFLFMDTVVNHFFLQLFRGAHKGLEGTFRAQAYSAAPMLLLIIPYLGLPMAIVATTVYKFLALRHVHDARPSQVLAALVVPMVLMFAVAIGLTWVMGTAV